MMKQEETFLRSQMKGENPFRVPEGYFDDFATRLMERLPEQPAQAVQPRTARLRVLRPLLYAACLCVAVFMGSMLYFNQSQADSQPVAQTVTADASYLDDMADYVMADNQDIYACLTTDY